MPVCHPVTVRELTPGQQRPPLCCAELVMHSLMWSGTMHVGYSASLDDSASSRTVHTESFILTNSALVIENPHSVYPYFKCCTNSNQWSRVILACYCHLQSQLGTTHLGRLLQFSSHIYSEPQTCIDLYTVHAMIRAIITNLCLFDAVCSPADD